MTAASIYLLVRSGLQLCGLPLPQVIEIFRALPVVSSSPAPAFVLGLARVRGLAVPVVDLRVLLGGNHEQEADRFVHLRLEDRRIALAVDEVLGLREVPASTPDELPPHLGASHPVVQELGSLDHELLLLLRSSHWSPSL